TAVWRLFNPYTTIGTHHFTTNKAEYEELQKFGWIGEGIGWYGTLSTVPRNVVPGGLYINNDCVYNEYRMKRYGIYKVSGKLYYFDPLNNGKKQTKEGLTTVYNSNNKIYISADGSLHTGAMKYQNKTYKWFDLNNGYMAKNTFVKIAAHLNDGIEARNYYDGNGDLLYGYYQINGQEIMYGSDKEPLTSLDSLWIRKNNYLTFAEQQHNAGLIWNYFINKGWSKNAIAALLGNMQAESNLNPGLWESLDENNLNCGYGLVQWTPASKIIEWLYANGFEKDSGFGQCERILYELQHNLQYYPTASYPLNFKEFIVSTESPEYLAIAFLVNYERPANYNQPQRQEYARYWYDYFTV
ncbi:hypothetical protein C815_01287, partial [Firmicutes bacterium M10-2]